MEKRNKKDVEMDDILRVFVIMVVVAVAAAMADILLRFLLVALCAVAVVGSTYWLFRYIKTSEGERGGNYDDE